jgi:hypothetical protein
VEGRGRTIEWRESEVTIYVKDSEGNEEGTALKKNPSGQLMLESGWKLYIAGGKFVEV